MQLDEYVVLNYHGHQEIYWTGDFQMDGRPKRTVEALRALRFETARDAYDHCEQYRALQSWRVGRRNESGYIPLK